MIHRLVYCSKVPAILRVHLENDDNRHHKLHKDSYHWLLFGYPMTQTTPE
ncbi:MAG: hypothetical protein ACFFDP_01280 [Promethearchaeota archaeon]